MLRSSRLLKTQTCLGLQALFVSRGMWYHHFMVSNGDALATKADLAQLGQRLDQNVARLDQNITRLDQKIDRVAVALVNTQADVREIRNTMSTKDDINRVLTAIDSFAKKAQNYDRVAVLHGRTLVEVEVSLKDHGERLEALESARP